MAPADSDSQNALRRAWFDVPPGRILGRGHPAGDFLEAYDWEVVEEAPGRLRLDVHLPPQAKNPRGQLFGGFAPTYVDLVALLTVRAGARLARGTWLATTNLRVDYFEPVLGPRFLIESRVIKHRRRVHFVETRFLDQESVLLIYAVTTLREIPQSKPLGDG